MIGYGLNIPFTISWKSFTKNFPQHVIKQLSELRLRDPARTRSSADIAAAQYCDLVPVRSREGVCIDLVGTHNDQGRYHMTRVLGRIPAPGGST
jgi:hypothetical protein